MAAASSINTLHTGAHVGVLGLLACLAYAKRCESPQLFLAGLILQLISFAIFTLLFLRFLYLVYGRERPIWLKDKHEAWRNDWRALASAMWLSCIGILVRPLPVPKPRVFIMSPQIRAFFRVV